MKKQKICKGKTASGEPCKTKAIIFGYCIPHYWKSKRGGEISKEIKEVEKILKKEVKRK